MRQCTKECCAKQKNPESVREAEAELISLKPNLGQELMTELLQKAKRMGHRMLHAFVTKKIDHLHCCGNILIKWRCKQMQHNATCERKRKMEVYDLHGVLLCAFK